MFTHAICRKPGPDFADGITTAGLGRPDFDRMLTMHAAYVETLQKLGLQVEVLEALPGHPDAYFVEDAAIMTAEVGIVTRPGAKARRGEEVIMEPVIAKYRPLKRIEDPGTLDGGDVLFVDRHALIGISERTNESGACQLGRILEAFGYTWRAVEVPDGLHFKSSVNWVGGNTLLVSPSFAGAPELQSYQKLVVPEEEVYATNTLLINNTLITPKGFPKTRELIDGLNLPILELDCTEPMKMDGGLTCLSLRF